MIPWLLASALAADPAASVLHLRARTEPVDPFLDAVYRHIGVQGPGAGGLRTTTGTAVVLGDPPWLVTNHHVVAGAATVTVEQHDGTVIAQVPWSDITVDVRADLALLPAPEGRPALPVHIQLTPGSPVTLWGFPGDGALASQQGMAGGLARHATPGAPVRAMLEIDADVGRGLSGGPVIDPRGRVVGLVVAGSTPDSALRGLGLAVPGVHLAAALAPRACPRPWAGVQVDPSVTITGLVDDGPAARAGLRVADRIDQVDGVPTATPWDLVAGCAGPSTWVVVRSERAIEVPVERRASPVAQATVTADDVVLQVSPDDAALGLEVGDALATTHPTMVRVDGKGWVVRGR